MTHEQKPESAEYRTREEIEAEMRRLFTHGVRGPNAAMQAVHRIFDEVRAFGALEEQSAGRAERRRKDAEWAEPFAWGVTLDIEMGYPFLAHKTPISPIPARNVPLYDRPANVAALEARVRELEGYEKDAMRFKWLVENVGLYYGIPGFAAERGRTPENYLKDLLSAIDANIERTAAAIREGDRV